MPKGKGKGQQRSRKHTVSTHDLRAEKNPEDPVPPKFAASINFTEVADKQDKTNSDMTIDLLKRLPGRERRNRSVNQFVGVLWEMAESAANHMETITLFEEPFPDIQRSEAILGNVWRSTERDHQTDHPRGNKIDAYVSLQGVLCLSWSWMLTTWC